MTAESAASVIARLNLAPHPEGGWYRETWRAPPEPGAPRSPGTAILFLLEAGQASHWHRIDATELWLFQAGAALTLKTAASDSGPIAAVRLGADILAGDAPQHAVAPGEWQAAQASPASDSGPIAAVRLGADILAGDAPQHAVAPGEWQAAQASPAGWALVACVVVPGFEFAGFELAPPGWAPGELG